jgi:hypothetical protein
VLPRLEETLEELKRHFEEEDKEKEMEPLEIKLNRLKNA